MDGLWQHEEGARRHRLTFVSDDGDPARGIVRGRSRTGRWDLVGHALTVRWRAGRQDILLVGFALDTYAGATESGDAIRGRRLTPPPANADAPSFHACSEEGLLRPARDDEPATLTFVNRRPGPVRIFWIDRDGERREAAHLRRGETWSIVTFVSHPWLVADAEGRCLELHSPTLGGSDVVLWSTLTHHARPPHRPTS